MNMSRERMMRTASLMAAGLLLVSVSATSPAATHGEAAPKTAKMAHPPKSPLTEVHVATNGNDTSPGTATAPIASLQKLESLLANEKNVEKVLLHAGVYYGTLVVAPPKDVETAKLHPLTIQAVDGDEVVIECGAPMRGLSEAVGKSKGVYLIRDTAALWNDKLKREGVVPRLWDGKARKRYLPVADERSVMAFETTYCFTSKGLLIHTHDGSPPERLEIYAARHDIAQSGVKLSRPQTTIRGLWVRNNLKDAMSSSGIELREKAAGSKVMNCRISNCPRGITVAAPDVEVVDCRTDDTATGVYIRSKSVTVARCRLMKIRDDFLLPTYFQEDTGIEVYYPAAGDIIMRNNVCRGFGRCAVFVKANPGRYVIESNTFIDNASGVGHSASEGKNFVIRNNIIYGSRLHEPVWPLKADSKMTILAEDNCLAPLPGQSQELFAQNVKYLNGVGGNNILANPRVAAPFDDDFRLLPDSPCLPGGFSKSLVGACGPAGDGFKDSQPPNVSLAQQKELTAGKGDDGTVPLFHAASRSVALAVQAHDGQTSVEKLQTRIGGQDWGAACPFAKTVTVELPDSPESTSVSVRVADKAGNWSAPVSVRILVPPKRLAIVGIPTIRANTHGCAITFRTNLPCAASGEYGPTEQYGHPLTVHGVETGDAIREEHALGFADEGAEDRKFRHVRLRLKLKGFEGYEGDDMTVALTGDSRTYYVSPEGKDVEDGGGRETSWRSVQYAVNRALPGDRVLLLPGVYPQTVCVTRSGTPSAPILIAAEQQGAAVFDGRHQIPGFFKLYAASHIALSGIEMRGYGKVAVEAVRCSDWTIRDCVIWNSLWKGYWAEGCAIRSSQSPRLTLEKCIIFNNEFGFQLNNSPDCRIRFNTILNNLYGVTFNDSSKGTVLRGNDLSFNGNDMYVLCVSSMEQLESFDADYNNLGTTLRDYDKNKRAYSIPNVFSQDVILRRSASKAVVRLETSSPDPAFARKVYKLKDDENIPRYRRFRLFEEWLEFSGKERHSIFADPRHHSLVDFAFELDPQSPNIGAGENRGIIGAVGVLTKK